MSKMQAGVGPVSASVAGFGTGLTTRQVTQMSSEERMEHMKFITELRKSIEQLKMESIESYAQVAGIEARVLGDVTAAYLDARSTGDMARANVLASLATEVNTRLKLLSDPDPELRNLLSTDALSLTTGVTGIGNNLPSKILTEQQLVDGVLTAMNNADANTATASTLAEMRNKFNYKNKDRSVGASGRALAALTTQASAEDAITSALTAVAEQKGLDPAVVMEAYLEKQSEFRQLINVAPTSDDLLAAKEYKDESKKEIELLKGEMLKAGASIDNIDYYLGKVNTGTLSELVSGGPSKLFKDLTDEKVAPETSRFVKTLMTELKQDTMKLDSFERGIANYNNIAGVPEARRALGLQDNYQFAFYVTNHADQFNDAIKYVRKNKKGDLTEEETAQLLGKYLAGGNENKAERLASSPGRMRRMLRRGSGGGGAVDTVASIQNQGALDDLSESEIQQIKRPEDKVSSRLTADDDERTREARAEQAAGQNVAAQRIASQQQLSQETKNIAASVAGETEETAPTPGDTPSGSSVIGGSRATSLSNEEAKQISTDIVENLGRISGDPSTIVAQAARYGHPGLTMADARKILDQHKVDLSGVKYSGVPKPPKTTAVDLQSASRGILEGPNVRDRTSLTRNELTDLRTVQNNRGVVQGAPNIKAFFQREGKNISYSTARRMAKYVEEKEAQRRMQERLQTSEPDVDPFDDTYDYEDYE